jgi:hypothetical protein
LNSFVDEFFDHTGKYNGVSGGAACQTKMSSPADVACTWRRSYELVGAEGAGALNPRISISPFFVEELAKLIRAALCVLARCSPFRDLWFIGLLHGRVHYTGKIVLTRIPPLHIESPALKLSWQCCDEN